jgi:predicted RND superfamily exporter protein
VAIHEQIEQNRLELGSPTAPFSQELITNDPLGLMPLFLNRLLGARSMLEVDLSDGYYLARDGRSLIMLVKPTGAWQDLEFDERLLAAARGAERTAREAWSAGVEEQTAGGITVRYSGHYAVAVDEAELIREDIRFNITVSLVAVLALYLVAYRRFAALFYSTVPLLVGQAMTFGLAYFALRSLNASSAAFTALLMGLGTDFVIVMYARYVEERRSGRTLTEATELMVGETGLGVFTGAITSAGTFYAMCISQFRGLRDLGFLIGSGILLCAVAIVFLVPAMIKWNEGVRSRRSDPLRKLHVQSFLLERLIPWSARHRVLVLSLVAVATAGGAWLASQLEFDDNVQVLRSNRSPAYRTQQEIGERFGASLSYMLAIAEAPTEAEAIELTRTIDARLAPWVEQGVVGSHDSLLSYLPAREDQETVLAALREDESGALDPVRVAATFREGLDRQGFRHEPFEPFLARLPDFLAPERPIGISDFEDRGLGRLVERYVDRDEGRVRAVTYIYLTDPRWRREPPPGLVGDLAQGNPGIVVTGTNVVGAEFRKVFEREAPRAVLLGVLVVFALLWIDFRSLRLTAIALGQLISGVSMMLGAMKLAGIHLNYVNAFVTTMILGVGIDYGIHVIHRMRVGQGRIEAGLLETGKAVVIAAFTNIAAFGTLALGNYPALRSFGLVALFGSVTCLLTALTFVPAMMVGRGNAE